MHTVAESAGQLICSGMKETPLMLCGHGCSATSDDALDTLNKAQDERHLTVFAKEGYNGCLLQFRKGSHNAKENLST